MDPWKGCISYKSGGKDLLGICRGLTPAEPRSVTAPSPGMESWDGITVIWLRTDFRTLSPRKLFRHSCGLILVSSTSAMQTLGRAAWWRQKPQVCPSLWSQRWPLQLPCHLHWPKINLLQPLLSLFPDNEHHPVDSCLAPSSQQVLCVAHWD